MELNSMPKKLHFFLLFLSSVLTLSHSLVTLDRSDYNAFKIIQRDLGITRQHPSFIRNPCNSPAVSCERRVAGNFTSGLRITRLAYDSEQLTGFLSPVVGQLTELRELTLSNNQIVDQLPQEIVGCRKLEILNLKNNRFSGPVPTQLSKLTRLKEIDLSSNKFSGELSFLTYFPNLESLFLSNNLFNGKIPTSLKSFRNLRYFDISGNANIQGSIPVLTGVEQSSSEVSRRYRLAETQNTTRGGTVPRRHNRTISLAPVQAPSPLPAIHKHHHRSKAKKLAAWLLGFLAGGIAGGISGSVFSVFVKVCLILIQGRGKGSEPAIFSPLIKKAEDLAFLEKDDGLASLELIGRGGCGEVYKAEIPGSNGRIIAIKKIYEPPKDAAELTEEDSKMLNKRMKQVRSEIQTVGRIRHRNLLPLLAHVPRADSQLLVYEYMKNGSLEDLMRQVVTGEREFDWLSRYRIALGVAAGLEYLHMNNSPRIIHRDLKPANILLDDDMEPRIADFGLAKEMPVEKTHMSTSNVAGTVGYIAPEYYQTSKFTDKCDIYSLGVVLGGLVIGKLPHDNFYQNTEEMCLVKWMRNVMTSDEPKRAIDPQLMGNGYEEQMLQVLKIACFCTLEDPKQRPNSKDIRCMLFQINH